MPSPPTRVADNTARTTAVAITSAAITARVIMFPGRLLRPVASAKIVSPSQGVCTRLIVRA